MMSQLLYQIEYHSHWTPPVVVLKNNIKTHDSESRGQEAGRTQRMSVLFTCNTAMKYVNALNKPP